MHQLQAMRVFVSIAEHGSFGHTALSLNMSNAVVTGYVALLEARLETRLINRNARAASLTWAGAVLGNADEHAHGVSVPSGTLSVVAHASFSLHDLTPMLKCYLDAYPKVRLLLTLLHRPDAQVEEGFDAGIVAPRQVSGRTMICRPLLSVAPVAVASPADLASRAPPLCPTDLARHTRLAPFADVHGNEWHFEGAGGVRANLW